MGMNQRVKIMCAWMGLGAWACAMGCDPLASDPYNDTAESSGSDSSTDTNKGTEPKETQSTSLDTESDTTEQESDSEPEALPSEVVYVAGLSLNGAPPNGSVSRIVLVRSADGTWAASGERWSEYDALPPGCLPSFEMPLRPEQKERLESALLAIVGMTCEPELEGTDDFDCPFQGLWIDGRQVANNHGCESRSSPYDFGAMDLIMAELDRFGMEESQGACLSTIGFERDKPSFLAPGIATVGEALWVKASVAEGGYVIEGEVVRAVEEAEPLLERVGPHPISNEAARALISLAMQLPGPTDALDLPETCAASEARGSEFLVAFPMVSTRHYSSPAGAFDAYGLENFFASWNSQCAGEWPSASAAQTAESLELSLTEVLSHTL